jgi:Secretion system C-terminal sorting domain
MKTTTTFKGMLFIACLVFKSLPLFSQNPANPLETSETKTLTVILVDKETREAIPFGNVLVFDLSSTQLTVGTTNMEGTTKLIAPSMNTYIIKGVYVGYDVTIDTIFCSKARCNRIDTLALETSKSVCFQFCCGCVFFSDVETEEEVYEAERQLERMEEETEIRADLNDFVCYPNPVEKMLNVTIHGTDATELIMMNVKGETLIRKEITLSDYQFELNLEMYAAGLYYVVCRGEGLSSNTRTIIKQ